MSVRILAAAGLSECIRWVLFGALAHGTAKTPDISTSVFEAPARRRSAMRVRVRVRVSLSLGLGLSLTLEIGLCKTRNTAELESLDLLLRLSQLARCAFQGAGQHCVHIQIAFRIGVCACTYASWMLDACMHVWCVEYVYWLAARTYVCLYASAHRPRYIYMNEFM